MNILQEELNEYYNSLLALGFKLVDEDVFDENVDVNDVRVTYKVLEVENDCTSEKDKINKLNEVPVLDFVQAYNYMSLKGNQNTDEYIKAIHVIAAVVKYDEEKIRLNNLLINEIMKANDIEKISSVKEAKESVETVAKAKEAILGYAPYIAGAALVGGAVIYAMSNNSGIRTNDPSYVYEEEVQEDNTVDETPVVEETAEEAVVEETPVEVNEENATEVNEEEVEVAFDINNDEAINATVDKIYNEVQAMDDENFKAEMDKDTIEAIVRYTRHSNGDYTGANYISNEYAYELLSEFFNKGYNIATFYENLENYDKLNDLVTKSLNIKNDKESYEDELEVYTSLDYAMNTLDSENYPEVIALRSVVDNVTVLESMKLVGGIGQENGLEGEEYNTENAKAFNVDAKEVFNKVDINNENAPLTQATYKAIEEDETLGLSR